MKDPEQMCFACNLKDCYYFECLKKSECEQFKRFERGERKNANGEIIEAAKDD